jgi:hypothetical protein
MALSLEELKELRKRITDPNEDMDPWDRVKFMTFLNKYGNGDEDDNITDTQKAKRDSFRGNYDRYYAPFMAGFGNASQSDILPPIYKQSNPFNKEKDILRKMKYNKMQNRWSNADPFLTAGAHGLGLMTAMSGGIPGLVGGYAIKHGVPLAWNLVKNHFANKYSRQKVANRQYKDILDKYPTL